ISRRSIFSKCRSCMGNMFEFLLSQPASEKRRTKAGIQNSRLFAIPAGAGGVFVLGLPQMLKSTFRLAMSARDKNSVDGRNGRCIGIDKRRSSDRRDKERIAVLRDRRSVSVRDTEARNIAPPRVLYSFDRFSKPAPKTDRYQQIFRRHYFYSVLHDPAATN